MVSNEMFRALRPFQLLWSYQDRVLLGNEAKYLLNMPNTQVRFEPCPISLKSSALPLGHRGPPCVVLRALLKTKVWKIRRIWNTLFCNCYRVIFGDYCIDELLVLVSRLRVWFACTGKTSEITQDFLIFSYYITYIIIILDRYNWLDITIIVQEMYYCVFLTNQFV